MAVEITMRQDAPAWKGYEHDEVRRTLLNPVSFFEVRSLTVPASRITYGSFCF
jgi:hypothetical protein